ncbi:MAG: hypothetical protein QF797_19795 [Alphaproteobacteria bacterium]|nr:hypothetical protein [Alphaproteobacteria bacterium]MDP6624053.1 hypothetical protein [Alphaproteobacteria bacterium]
MQRQRDVIKVTVALAEEIEIPGDSPLRAASSSNWSQVTLWARAGDDSSTTDAAASKPAVNQNLPDRIALPSDFSNNIIDLCFSLVVPGNDAKPSPVRSGFNVGGATISTAQLMAQGRHRRLGAKTAKQQRQRQHGVVAAGIAPGPNVDPPGSQLSQGRRFTTGFLGADFFPTHDNRILILLS